MRRTLTILVAAVALAGCAAERHEVAYTDIFDAKGQEATDRGWVPEWLPESATDIREVHAGDTGNSLLTASWPRGTELPADCVPADAPPPPELDADWFPDDVVELGTVSVCDDGSYVVIAHGALYRWTVPTS